VQFIALDARHLLPASYALSSALSVFFTLCASTIKKLVMALRPCLVRAAPTDFFKARSRTLMPS